MKKPSIIINNLFVKMQSNIILDDISFVLQPGQHLAVTGPSGSGKTMLAKALAGKLFYHGTITFDKPNSVITFVEQHYQFKTLSNTFEFYYQQRYNSIDSSDALTVSDELQKLCTNQTQINALLQQINLGHKRESPLLHLSSGEHKRFQLVKALLVHSDILILDEPFVGLDINSRKQLNNILLRLADSGTQIICITGTHEIPSCITHIAHLENGILKEFGQKTAFETPIAEIPSDHHYSFAFPLPANSERLDFSNAIQMVNVSVKYGGKQVLDNINWQVNHGEKWSLKGHNGAGKSTLLSLVFGDNPQAYANEIYLFDKRRGSGESIWELKQKIGYVSPELQWYFDTSTTCYQAIASGFFDTIGLFKKLTDQQHKTTEQWLDLLRLSHVKNRLLSTMSTSELRLTLLARALVKDPPLLLLDEPCQGLDDEQTRIFTELIDELCLYLDKTLVYISHYEHELPQCIDRVIELNQGKATIYSINKQTSLAI